MKRIFLLFGVVAMLMPSCKSLTGTQKGAGIGAGAGTSGAAPQPRGAGPSSA